MLPTFFGSEFPPISSTNRMRTRVPQSSTCSTRMRCGRRPSRATCRGPVPISALARLVHGPALGRGSDGAPPPGAPAMHRGIGRAWQLTWPNQKWALTRLPAKTAMTSLGPRLAAHDAMQRPRREFDPPRGRWAGAPKGQDRTRAAGGRPTTDGKTRPAGGAARRAGRAPIGGGLGGRGRHGLHPSPLPHTRQRHLREVC